MYWCPAPTYTWGPENEQRYCGFHMLPVSGDSNGKPMWTMHSLDPLHLEPSVLTRSNYNGEPYVCHCFVRNGMIEFLSDCTHALAGQTVPVPDMPTYEDD